MIRTQGLTKFQGDLVTVYHVDLAIEEGEVCGLLGPNGAGKTTTIQMLATPRADAAGAGPPPLRRIGTARGGQARARPRRTHAEIRRGIRAGAFRRAVASAQGRI